MKCDNCTDKSMIWRLRHKITIQKETEVPDGGGGFEIGWTNFASGVFASVEPLRGRELFEAQQLQSEITHRIRLRYRPGIKAEMRVVFRSRIFRIVSPPINEKEENRWMQLMCEEVGTDAEN